MGACVDDHDTPEAPPLDFARGALSAQSKGEALS